MSHANNSTLSQFGLDALQLQFADMESEPELDVTANAVDPEGPEGRVPVPSPSPSRDANPGTFFHASCQCGTWLQWLQNELCHMMDVKFD